MPSSDPDPTPSLSSIWEELSTTGATEDMLKRLRAMTDTGWATIDRQLSGPISSSLAALVRSDDVYLGVIRRSKRSGPTG